MLRVVFIFPVYIGITNYGCDALHHGKYTGCTGMRVIKILCLHKIMYIRLCAFALDFFFLFQLACECKINGL